MSTGALKTTQSVRRILSGGIAAVAVVAIVIVSTAGSEYQVYVGTIAASYVVSMVGFNLAFGIAKLFTLAHVAFFGVGAYAYAYAAEDLGLAHWLAFVVAAAAGMVMAGLVSLVAWRVSDLMLALVTFAVGSLTQIVFQRAGTFTGGNVGKSVSPIDGLSAQGQFLLTAAIAAAAVVAAVVLARTRVGRRWTALGDSEPAASSAGINPRKEKMLAFAASGVFGGLAGALYMQTVQYVTPESFGFAALTLLLVAVTVGGPGSPLGTGVAIVAVVVVNEALRSYPSVQAILYGAALLLVLALRGRHWLGRLPQRVRRVS